MNILDPHESRRLAAVRRYDVLDTPPDGAFDRITRIAATMFRVPISIVSIVDEDRIWFKSAHGVDVPEIPRSPGLCASAILSDAPWLITDATKDLRSLANPLVAGEFGLRFYLGIPLRTHDGFNLGTLCVIDKQPRQVTDAEVTVLTDLASIVLDELELRLSANRMVQQREALIREVHHRVKNNLQVISSLLNVQRRNAPAEAHPFFDETIRRVHLMGVLHQKFYSGPEIDRIEVKEYLMHLCEVIIDSLGLASRVLPVVRGPSMIVDLNIATPLTLLITELVTNSCKYAFEDDQRGLIRLEIEELDEQLQIEVSDDGRGFIVEQVRPGMGTKLMNSFAIQMRGTIERNNAKQGTSFRITLPKPSAHIQT